MTEETAETRAAALARVAERADLLARLSRTAGELDDAQIERVIAYAHRIRTCRDLECAGAGHCHGPARWCYACGDVSKTCASGCDLHRCFACGKAPVAYADHGAGDCGAHNPAYCDRCGLDLGDAPGETCWACRSATSEES